MTKRLKSSLLLLAGALLSSCGWTTAPQITVITDVQLSEGTLTPEFDAAVTDYEATVPYAIDGVDVTVSSDNPNLVVTINSTPVLPGSGTASIALAEGTNTVTIVASDEEESATYTVVVTRLPAPEITVISDVSLSESALSPEFDVAVTDYTATVPNATESVGVTVSSDNPDLAVTINDTPVLPGSGTATIALEPGENTITIVVGDGMESVTYTVVVTRLTEPEITVIHDRLETVLENGSTVSFGATYEGRTLSFTIRNTGSAPLTLTGTPPNYITIENHDDQGNFVVSVQPTSNPIAPGEEVTFSIEFINGSGSGVKFATVTITNDDDDEATFTLSLAGYLYC